MILMLSLQSAGEDAGYAVAAENPQLEDWCTINESLAQRSCY